MFFSTPELYSRSKTRAISSALRGEQRCPRLYFAYKALVAKYKHYLFYPGDEDVDIALWNGQIERDVVAVGIDPGIFDDPAVKLLVGTF